MTTLTDRPAGAPVVPLGMPLVGGSHERTHGAGIGLALVRQIIDAHQGTIDIVSEQHRGATFVVTFPAHAGAQIPRARSVPALLSQPPAA